MKRFAWSLCAVLVLALGVPRDADAFYIEVRTLADGGAMVAPTYATAMPLEFRIAMDDLPIGDSSEVAAIQAAFDTVGAVACSELDFMQGARVPRAMIDPRHWQTDMTRYLLVYWSSDASIWGTSRGVGRFDFAHDGAGNMIGATIVLNSSDHSWSTTGEADKLDVQGTVTALLVRSLGVTSTMMGNASYPAYRPGDTSKRMLGPDDIAGVTYLYGDGSMGCGMTMPEGMCSDGDPACPPTPAIDAGMGTRLDGGGTPPPRDAGVSPLDGGGVAPPADDGCGCRVAGARARGASEPWALLGIAGATLALVLTLRRRRRG